MIKLKTLILQLVHHFNFMDYLRSDFLFFRNKIKNSQINQNLKKDHLIDHKCNKNFDIKEISSLDNLKNNSILFSDVLDFDYFRISKNDNIHIITSNYKLIENFDLSNYSLVKKLDSSFVEIINKIFIHNDSIDFKDNFLNINNSYISEYASIHPSTIIEPNCCIGRGVKIGKNCIIKSNSIIKNSILLNNVIISENCTIGSTGFGFNLNNMGSSNILPHIGIVCIEDNVFIGANCTIDRAKIDATLVGKNSMLDNQIHIAHNVIIGNNACIAAQSGIAGSVRIGNNLITGGQVGIAGHLRIGDNVVIAAKSGVTKNIDDNKKVGGFPAIDLTKWKKSIIKNR